VVLFRNNKDAFSASNMNRLKAGKVLQIPGDDEAAEIGLKEARREVRLQTADFNAYRERIAAAAGIGQPTTEQAGQSAAGGVTGTVEDKGAPALAQPKEVLKLSKGDAAGAAAAQERIRSLEEEVAAREKTIKEQTDRVARLEKTVKDMQALLDIKSKGMADAQKQAGKAAPAPATPAMPATAAAATPAAAAPAAPAPADTTSVPAPPPPAPEAVAATTSPGAPAPETQPSAAPMAQSATPAAPTAAQPGVAAKPKPRVRAAPPPPAESSLIDDLLGNPLYLAGGGPRSACSGS
jgi:pilus assembly protein FimV